MTTSRTTRLLILASMFVSMAVVLAWAGWIGWREWPRWRAVREMRAAVEANEPGRFLDAIERVDSLGVAEAAADEIAPLRQHPDPRVRMYAVMARTVLGPRGPNEAKELIQLFENPDEDIHLRITAIMCLGRFGEQARDAIPSLDYAFRDFQGNGTAELILREHLDDMRERIIDALNGRPWDDAGGWFMLTDLIIGVESPVLADELRELDRITQSR